MGFFGSDISLPEPPKYYEDQRFGGGIDSMFSYGNQLTNLDFSNNPLMQDTINLDPEVTKLALQQAQGALMPSFNRTRQNTINDLANYGALQSSTTADALARSDYDLNSQLQSIVSGAALDDRTRALNNRTSLFGTGLNLFETGTNMAGQNQQMRNNFNLSNYENQVAKIMAEGGDNRMGSTLTGALGGGIQGFMMGGPAGAVLGAGLGGFAGYAGGSGTGGQILNASSLIAGSGGFGGVKPGSTAGVGSNLTKQSNPYSLKGFDASNYALFN